MTRDEAVSVCKVMLNADGGCYICSGQLLGLFAKRFPEHLEVAQQVYKEAGHSWEAWKD
jgi:hypothetical protein